MWTLLILTVMVASCTGAPANDSSLELLPLNIKCSMLVYTPEANRNNSCYVNCVLFNKDGGYCDQEDNCMCYMGTPNSRVTIVSPTPPKCSDMDSTYIKDEELNCYMACAVSGYYGGTCMEDFCLCLENRKPDMKIDLRGVDQCSQLQEVHRKACGYKCTAEKHVGGYCEDIDGQCQCLSLSINQQVKHGDRIGLVTSEGVEKKVEVTQLLQASRKTYCSSLRAITKTQSKKGLCSMFCSKYNFHGGFCGVQDECLCVKHVKGLDELGVRIEDLTTTTEGYDETSTYAPEYDYWATEDDQVPTTIASIAE